jgi:hypothetical protein
MSERRAGADRGTGGGRRGAAQPVISPGGCRVACAVAPARPGTAQRRRHLRPHRHALGQLAERRGAWPGDDLTAITLTTSLTGQAGRFLPELVTSARLNGHTWHDIAQTLATSPDEARRRSDPDSPVADGRWPYDT